MVSHGMNSQINELIKKKCHNKWTKREIYKFQNKKVDVDKLIIK